MAASLSARLFSFDGCECTDSSDSSKGNNEADEEEPFVGQTEELLRRVFERARQAAAAGSTVMLLLDDLDVWCPARGDASTAVSARTVAQVSIHVCLLSSTHQRIQSCLNISAACSDGRTTQQQWTDCGWCDLKTTEYRRCASACWQVPFLYCIFYRFFRS
jgi:hypothetical protein